MQPQPKKPKESIKVRRGRQGPFPGLCILHNLRRAVSGLQKLMGCGGTRLVPLAQLCPNDSW